MTTLTYVRTLHVTSPLTSGDDVLDLQARLEELGYPVGELDGRYGPATAAAVRAFQLDNGLEADGIAGPATFAALSDAEPRDPASVEPSEIGRLALAEAVCHIGVKESPPQSNRTPFGEWFGVDGVKWCNVFVSYCFGVGAGYTLCEGFTGAGVYPRGCTYVPTTEAWLRATNMWVGRTTPLLGDIAIFNWDGGAPDHIGIVEEDHGDGTFSTIEGNTGSSSWSDGGAVLRCTRRLSQVNGFGRVV
jgi:putative peptidoglycan binding protein/CHAP domain-containing protein